MRRGFFLLLTFFMVCIARSQTAYYWFDEQAPEKWTQTSTTDGRLDIDVSSLLQGVHALHYSVVDENDILGPAETAIFIKPYTSAGGGTADSYCYWFDDDYANAVRGTLPKDGAMVLSVASLLHGVHALHYSIADKDGTLGPPETAIFIKPYTSAEGGAGDSYCYWFDDDLAHATRGTIPDGGVMMLDVSTMLQGVHALHYSITDKDGTLGPPETAIFIKPSTSGSGTSDNYCYWFDEDLDGAKRGTLPAGGAMLIDVSALSGGVHFLHYYIEAEGPTSPSSAVFIKTPFADILAVESLNCVSYIDGTQTEVAVLPPEGGLVAWQQDVSALNAGLHQQRVALYNQNDILLDDSTALFMHLPDTTIKERDTYVIDMSADTQGRTFTFKSSDTGVATVSTKGVVTGVKIGTTTLTVTGSDGQSYACTLRVKEMDQITVTVKDTVRSYGDANPQFEYTVSGGSVTGVPQITCDAVATSATGTYEIKIAKGTLDYPNLKLVGGTLTVEKAPLTVKADDQTMKQAGAVPPLTVSYSGFKNGESESVLTAKPTASTTATAESEPGEYPITVSGGEAQNYALAYEAGTLTVTEADEVTITVVDAQREYGDDNPQFEYTVSGGTVKGTPRITCDAGRRTAVGSYDIMISAGDIKYPKLTLVGGTLTVERAPLTVKADNKVMKQGDPVPSLTYSISGFKNGESESVLTVMPEATTTATPLSPEGAYPITVSGGEAQNYELQYEDGLLTVTQADPITITVVSAKREYGDENPTFEYTMSGGTIAGTPTLTCDAGKDAPVGTYEIRVDAGTMDYPNLVLVGGTLTVERAALTVKADDQTMKQASAVPELTVSYSGFKNSETESVLTRTPTVTTTATPESAIGQYPITVSGGEARNYTLSYENGTLTVTEADQVTLAVTAAQREYGDDNPTFEYTVTGGTIQGTPTITCDAGREAAVGTYDIRIEAGDIRYPNLVLVDGTLTVTKAPLTVKADNKAMKEGDAVPPLTLSYTGFKNGETEDVLTVKPTVTTTATAESTPGSYPITVTGGEAQNYELTCQDGTLTVMEPDQIVIMATDAERVYGEENPPFEYTVTGGTIEGTPTLTCAVGKDAPVGTYEIRVEAGTVDYPNVVLVGGTLTVTKAPLTVTADDQTMTEGEAVPELTVSYTGFKNDETEAVLTTLPTASTTATAESQPGEYPITVSGGEARNYILTYQGGRLTVEKKPEQLVVTVNLTSGEVSQGTEIALGVKDSQGNDVDGATVWYTLDGTEPSEGSLRYGDAIVLDASCTLKAVAMKTGYTTSEVLTETYTVMADDADGQWEDAYGVVYAFNTGEDRSRVRRVKNVAAGDVVIRSEITCDNKTYTVTEIPKRAFAGASGVTSVTVPPTVTSVGEGAFSNEALLALVWQSSADVPANCLADESQRSKNFLLFVNDASQAPVDGGISNVAVKTPDGYELQGALTLVDGDAFHSPVAFHAASVSYTHSYQMTSGLGSSEGWETLSLPFDVGSVRHADGRVLVPFASYRAESENCPFWLYTLSEEGFVKTARIEANTPYIVCMPNNENYLPEYNVAGEVTFTAQDVTVPPSFDVKSVTAGGRTFVPTFRKIRSSSSVATLNSVNRLHSNTGGEAPGSRFISNLRLASPFEAVFEGSADAVRSFGLQFSTDGVNAIDEVPAARHASSPRIYNLQGQRVSTMRKGNLYIMGGKKAMAR